MKLRGHSFFYFRKKKNPRTVEALGFLLGSGRRIRTLTYRVRVCCATLTQSRYLFAALAERRCYYSKLQRNVNRKIEKNKKLWAGVSGPRERGQWRLGSPVLSWGCSCFLLWGCLQSWGAGFWFLDFFCSLCWFCMVLTSLSPSLACPGASGFIQKLSDFRDTNGGQSMV